MEISFKNEISMCFIINVDTNILARAEGIEPTSLVLETNIITIILSTHNVPRLGLEPRIEA